MRLVLSGERCAAVLFFLAAQVLFSRSVPAQGNWQAEWEKISAAAEKEGQISIGGPPGDTYRFALMEVFQKKYPKITGRRLRRS